MFHYCHSCYFSFASSNNPLQGLKDEQKGRLLCVRVRYELKNFGFSVHECFLLERFIESELYISYSVFTQTGPARTANERLSFAAGRDWERCLREAFVRETCCCGTRG